MTTQTLSPIHTTRLPQVVVGIIHDRQAYLYDAPEFRPARPNEIVQGYRHMLQVASGKPTLYAIPAWTVDAEVHEATKAGRYWPGEDVMAERELAETYEGFLAGAR